MEVDPVATIEQHFGIILKQKTASEWAGPCPFCGGTDRLRVWTEGNYACRPGPGHCGRKGWVDELTGDHHRLTDVERRVMALEREQARAKREREEHARRITALERMAQCRDHLTYHQQLDDDDRAAWYAQGIYDDAIDKYLLGICYQCPTDREHRPSYTIPVINGGALVNIRHRLIGTENGDKYRPHMAGLGNTLFNADLVYKPDTSSILVCEGEKKSIVLDEQGLPAVGTMGKAGFQPAWAKRFAKFGRVYVAYDPDAEEKARETAHLFNGRGWVVEIPVKADDFFTIYGGTADQFREFLALARRVD